MIHFLYTFHIKAKSIQTSHKILLAVSSCAVVVGHMSASQHVYWGQMIP